MVSKGHPHAIQPFFTVQCVVHIHKRHTNVTYRACVLNMQGILGKMPQPLPPIVNHYMQHKNSRILNIEYYKYPGKYLTLNYLQEIVIIIPR